MPDDKTKLGGRDRTFVHIGEDGEVAEWSKRFGVSADQLREAVAHVGVCVECGTPFAESSGWPSAMCGQCMADRIESSLKIALFGPRKPAKRAGDLKRKPGADDEEVQRSA